MDRQTARLNKYNTKNKSEHTFVLTNTWIWKYYIFMNRLWSNIFTIANLVETKNLMLGTCTDFTKDLWDNYILCIANLIQM
jgi:hypothetical protein